MRLSEALTADLPFLHCRLDRAGSRGPTEGYHAVRLIPPQVDAVPLAGHERVIALIFANVSHQQTLAFPPRFTRPLQNPGNEARIIIREAIPNGDLR